MSENSFKVFLNNILWYIDRDKHGFYLIVDTNTMKYIIRLKTYYPKPYEINRALREVWSDNLNKIRCIVI